MPLALPDALPAALPAPPPVALPDLAPALPPLLVPPLPWLLLGEPPAAGEPYSLWSRLPCAGGTPVRDAESSLLPGVRPPSREADSPLRPGERDCCMHCSRADPVRPSHDVPLAEPVALPLADPLAEPLVAPPLDLLVVSAASDTPDKASDTAAAIASI